MRDYYKILGLKKNPSEEEIRELWLKLVRKFHPDQRTEGAGYEERIREINEAYQVLKYSCTRVEYDLKRAHDQKKRGLNFRKLSIRVGILIVLLILGTIYLKGPPIIIQQASVTQDKISEMDHRNQIDQANRRNQTDDSNDLNDQNVPNVPNDQRMAASPHSRADASTDLIATEEEVKQFFANYTDRYTGKDLDGFLSLFSQRVIQNRRYGPERIRKIYADFFNQSQEVQYSLDDIKIEIYQNGVEVKARYEIIQRLKKGEKRLWGGDIRWTLTKEKGALKILSLDNQHQKSP